MWSAGVVRLWHDDEGWGVLDSPATPGGCWVHFSAVELPGRRRLAPDQQVDFTFEAAEQDGWSFRAERVRPVGWSPARDEPGPASGSADDAARSLLVVSFDGDGDGDGDGRDDGERDDGGRAGQRERCPGPPPRPPWFDELLADVDRAFVVTGAATPGWPDPHLDRSPVDEEYSRCTDPGKYRILETRVDAWAQVLSARGVATVERAASARWFLPAVPGGLALVVTARSARNEPLVLDLAVARPDGAVAVLDRVPDCGCDACDSGSADLLQVLDGWVLTVARGGVLHARAGDTHVTRTLDGWASSGGDRREADAWLDAAVPAHGGVERWTGTPGR